MTAGTVEPEGQSTEGQGQSTEGQGQQDQGQQQGNPADNTLGDAGKQALDRMKAERDEAKRTAKAATAEMEKSRKAAMSDAEKQVAEAETRGRQSAITEFGQRLARSTFDALAAKRNPEADATDIVDVARLDMARFLTDEGEPDTAALQAAVDRLVPAPQTGPPSQDGGARGTSAKAPSMNDLIRRQAGR